MRSTPFPGIALLRGGIERRHCERLPEPAIDQRGAVEGVGDGRAGGRPPEPVREIVERARAGNAAAPIEDPPRHPPAIGPAIRSG